MQERTIDQRPDPFDLVIYLWARRKLIFGIMLAGLVTGIAAAFLITPCTRAR